MTARPFSRCAAQKRRGTEHPWQTNRICMAVQARRVHAIALEILLQLYDSKYSYSHMPFWREPPR